MIVENTVFFSNIYFEIWKHISCIWGHKHHHHVSLDKDHQIILDGDHHHHHVSLDKHHQVIIHDHEHEHERDYHSPKNKYYNYYINKYRNKLNILTDNLNYPAIQNSNRVKYSLKCWDFQRLFHSAMLALFFWLIRDSFREDKATIQK